MKQLLVFKMTKDVVNLKFHFRINIMIIIVLLDYITSFTTRFDNEMLFVLANICFFHQISFDPMAKTGMIKRYDCCINKFLF